MGSKLVLQVSLATILALASSAAGSAVGPQAYVEVWTDKGEGEIYNRGEAIDIFVESSFDAYVLVYTIDTDGYLNVVFPYDCRDDGFLLGGKTYRIVTGKSDAYYAQGSKGVAYIRAVASATPFRRLYWPGCPGYERYAEDVTWTSFADYWGPALPPQIYGDPYVAMQSIDEFICWDAVNTGAVSVGYTYYYVMEVVERPVYYVRAGWYLPHTWYWPCWDVYWNVCWDACWGVSLRFGSWYSYGRPCGWSWYGPTWCAPSWCWPTWYRPYYAYCGPSYCGPRYTVCATRYCGSCSRCTGSTCRTYPSRVKYKTNRLAAGGAGGTKVKAGQSAREYDLYTRDNGAAIKRKTYATAEDREGLSKIKQVSRRDASSSGRAVKSKSSRKLYSTEGGRSTAEKVVAEDSAGDRKESARKPSSKQDTTERKAVRKTPVPVEAGSDGKKTSGRRSYEASETESSSRKATVSKKASQIKSSTTRSETKVRTQSKVSISKKAARVSSSRRVTTSSSSGGSGRNHRGSPTTRRSISR